MISNLDQRVLFWDSSANAFTDLTKEVNDYKEGFVSLDFESGDYLYFGSFLPFNHKFFRLGSPNGTQAKATVETFDGTNWIQSIDQLDYTERNGATFARSGILQFQVDSYDETWQLVDRTQQEQSLPEFSNGPNIYNKYWGRISFDTSISFQLRYVGSKFCDDNDLLARYPFLSNATILNSWAQDKTDWEEQEIDASEFIIYDLKRRSLMTERSQVIELSVLREPAIHKTAQMIWSGLGPRNYAEEISSAAGLYIDSMNQNKFELDLNSNATKDRGEMSVSVNRFSR